MTIKYGEFEHPTDFGFTGSAGKPHVKPHVRSAPIKRPRAREVSKGGLDAINFTGVMAPVIKPV